MGRVAQSFRFLWRALDGLRRVLHLVLLLLLFGVFALAFRHPLPMVPSKAALVVRLQGRLVEQFSGSPLNRSLGLMTGDHEPETLVRDVVDALREAAHDDRIRLVVLDTADLSGGGLTKLRAVADALQEFRKSGKKVYAYARYTTQEQYYLMAQADRAYIDPTGEITITGFAAYGLYFHDALERLGVTVEVFKVGTHKSFTEPFTRQSMSAEDREQTLGWMTPLWQSYVDGVQSARHLPAGAIDAYVHDTVALLKAVDGNAALLAEQRGLVNGLKSSLEFEREIAALVGEDSSTHSFNAVDQADYLAAVGPESALSRHPAGEVAVLVAAGDIVTGDGGPGQIGADTFAESLRKARFEDDVKAVVLRIDSGGGSMLASEVIRQEVAALKAAGKPVIASFSSVAASGGYYIAMEADQIWSEPTTITGSIGVFGMTATFERTLDKLGVSSDGVATSSLAGAMHPERALAPETREVLQLGVAHAYHDFVGRVAAARKKAPADIEAVAEGRVWIGAEAQKLGLVDRLGGVDAAVKAAAGLAKLPVGKYGVSWREKEMSWRERLMRELGADGQALARATGLLPATPAILTQVLGGAERELRTLGSLDDPRHVYAYCGCAPR
ncbi:MAG: signal peptide peptidase SppA [Proteobacteria bacterium]|nr:signal peptide peptidase SppA [Pseudomonadota bacterium]